MIFEGLLYRLMPGIFGSTGGTVAASITWPMSALSSPGQRTRLPSDGDRTQDSDNQKGKIIICSREQCLVHGLRAWWGKDQQVETVYSKHYYPPPSIQGILHRFRSLR